MDAFDWQAFHFLRPLALLGLIPAIALAAWYALGRAAGGAFESLLSPALRVVLLSRGEGANRWLLPLGIASILGLGAIAVAGPTWQRQELPTREVDEALVVLFDLSLSMYAQDTPPSRLQRARLELADLLRLRTEGSTALIAFAGDAHVVTPLTDDVATIAHMTNALTPNIMPLRGSRTDKAIRLGNQLLRGADQGTGHLLLITDGIHALEDLASACEPRHTLSILGVGTATGAPVPVPVASGQTEMLRDARGQHVIARLQEDKLRLLASLCGGRYQTARIGDEDLTGLLPDPGDPSRTLSESSGESQVEMWVDMTWLFALPLVPMLLLAMRRGALPVLLLCLLFSADASASWWDSLWKRADQQGFEALGEANPQAAATLFENQRWRGVSHFQGQSFEAAVRAFDSIEHKNADDYYNLGNSLAFNGRVDAAISAYETALERDPQHADAAHNKALLEAMQRSMQEGGDSREQSGEYENASDSTDMHESQMSSRSTADTQEGTAQEGTAQEGTDDAQSAQASQASEQSPDEDEGSLLQEREQDDAQQDEQDDATRQALHTDETSEQQASPPDPQDLIIQQARQRERIESLLRRVPDDPGGLLRQKFLLEAEARERAGESRQDSQAPW